MDWIWPKQIKPGMTLGFTAPASAAQEDLAHLERLAKARGYEVLFGPSCYRQGLYGGTPEEQAQEFNELMTTAACEAVIALRGGYGSVRYLHLLDYEGIRQYAKPFVGYSDCTALHCAIGRYSRLITYHGPMGVDWVKPDRETDLVHLFDLLEGRTSVIEPLLAPPRGFIGATKADTLIGNGPFKLVKWQHSAELQFVKNERYWDAAKVRLEAMEWPISESQSTRLTLVEGGAADIMVEPPVADQARLSELGFFKVAPSLGTYYYVFNVTAPPFDNPLVRKAFSLVIDRKVIVDTIVHGGKTPAYAFVPPGLTDEATGQDFRKEGGPLVDYNVAEAKRLLQDAGYGPNKPLPPVTILYNTNEMHKAIAEAVQAIWQNELGATVALQNQETKVFMANREEGHYQVARASWIGDYADPQTFLDVFSDEANDAQYHSEAYNALMERVHNTTDLKVRSQLMHEAEAMIFDDSVVLPIYFTTTPCVVRDTIDGFFWSSLGTIDFKGAYRK